MKKYLPVVVLLVGILAIGGVFILKGKNATPVVEEEEQAPEVPVSERPYTTLTPSEDKDGNYGHYLTLNIQDVRVSGATSVDYELFYKTKEGNTQGVPGTVKFSPGDNVEKHLLLGSESSGKFRYDEGVEEGTLSLKFRNADGKLIGKLSTQFHILTNTASLTSLDGKFTASLNAPTQDFYVVMNTFGLPESAPVTVENGPYGVFTSSTGATNVTIKMDGSRVLVWDGSAWAEVSGKSPLGTFVSGN